jgi:hypothetical protein
VSQQLSLSLSLPLSLYLSLSLSLSIYLNIRSPPPLVVVICLFSKTILQSVQSLDGRKVDRSEFEAALTDLTSVLASKINTAELTTLLDAVPTHGQMSEYLRNKADSVQLAEIKDSVCTMCVDLEKEVHSRAPAAAVQQLTHTVQGLEDRMHSKLDSDVFYMSQGLMADRQTNVQKGIQELRLKRR